MSEARSLILATVSRAILSGVIIFLLFSSPTNFRAGLLEHAQLLHTVADVLLHRLPDLGSRGVGAKSVGFPQFRSIALDGDGHRDLHAVHTPLWFPMEYSPSLAP